MHRLFVGLRPPSAMREALFDIMDGVEGARWQDDDQLHVTLRYIGEVERPVAEDIALALQSIHAPAIDLALSGVGRFDTGRRGRALWAGVAPHDAVAALHRKVDHALVRIGLPPEGRAYLPHVTLARLNAASGPTEEFLRIHAALTLPPMRVDHFTLFESHLGRDGAWYEPVARYPLLAAPSPS
ncbi:RNA 2',3'-cyclic phosphodiesterase [Sphingomonas sp. 2R-10]|uniref:RNA 2',3'-cyclic phosphodiesterase n=1 Tax=Sphingomonas sp. 2R-10 TaxID=3045148 RepID=UPI000F77C8C0|nr:RNA 2',3'-cyclic phosphodiesterase [Sphingomonas sp. 2R-10]MDJ0277978.1 RNA 2',3'-cyclic phosphodiesterase [Sphingomonas sp. 2R-10]